MSDRGIESLSGSMDQGVAPQTEGIKDLSTKEITALPNDEFEKRLDNIFGEKRSDAGIVELEEQTQEEDKKSVATRVAAAAVAATLLGGAGVALSPTGANAETKTPTKIVTEGNFSSDEALTKMGVKASAGTSDGTPAAQPTPLGPEATPSILDLVDDEYIKETREIFMDFDSSLPIERIKNCVEADRIRTLEDNKNFFRNLGVEDEYWLVVGAKGLAAYDIKIMGDLGNFRNYVSREEFINKIVNGDKKDFFCDKDGHPLFLLVNFTDKMKKGLKTGADKLEKGGIDNLYESWHNSGVWLLYADCLRPEPEAGLTQSLINQYGIINFNFTMDIPEAKKINLTNTFAGNMEVETIGVENLQLYRALRLYEIGLNEHYSVLCDNVKNVTASKIMANLSNELKGFASGFYKEAKDGADRENVPIDGELTQRLTEATLAVYEIPGENLLEGKK